MKNYDVIVAGTGSMGSSACWWLAKSGYNVLGLDQFSIPHTHGSHAGQSRIIRKAYFEHPGYIPLLSKAYENWKELEKETGEQVYHKTGLVYHGPAGHLVIKGVKEAAAFHNIIIEDRTVFQSPFILPGSFESVFEPDAGFLQPEKSMRLLKQQAVKHGAVIQENERIIEWRKTGKHIQVITDKETYCAAKLIITTGAWAGKMIPQLSVPLTVTRQLVVWMTPASKKLFSPPLFCCWLIADEKRPGALYGFPFLSRQQFGEPEGLKFAWHHPSDITNPDAVNREISEKEINKLVIDVAEYIPAVAEMELAAAKTCLYTNSKDENFIIDFLPGFDSDVVIACGFSGHGFKFVSVVGEILADLAMKGTTPLPVNFLGLNRFA